MHCKTSYDFGGKDPTLLWLCPHFGHVIGELSLAHVEQDEAGTTEGTAEAPAGEGEDSPDGTAVAGEGE